MDGVRASSVSLIGLDGFLNEIVIGESKTGKFEVYGLGKFQTKEAQWRVSNAVHPIARSKSAINALSATLTGEVKVGLNHDVAIAVAAMHRLGLVRDEMLDGTVFHGSILSSGLVMGTKGSINAAVAAKEAGFKRIVVPRLDGMHVQNIVDGIEVVGISCVRDLAVKKFVSKPLGPTSYSSNAFINIGQIVAREDAKRAIEVAAVGGHHVMFVGENGSGYTMMSRALCGILPPISRERLIESARIHDIHGSVLGGAPFRAPHHTTSFASLCGVSGGLPGEVSLAHGGVLALGDAGEFNRRDMEGVAHAMRRKSVKLTARNGKTCVMPADFIAALSFRPKTERLLSYKMADLIDIRVQLDILSPDTIRRGSYGDSSAVVAERVADAVEFNDKCGDTSVIDKEAHVKCLDHLKTLDGDSAKLIRVARSIAGLAGSEEIKLEHFIEAEGLILRN